MPRTNRPGGASREWMRRLYQEQPPGSARKAAAAKKIQQKEQITANKIDNPQKRC